MMNDIKYYAVKTICGHVGRTKYIEIVFPIIATSGSEAASIARRKPRVKHDRKDAIVSVNEITLEEYEKIVEKNDNDPYLKCKNKQEQKQYCVDIYERVIQHNNKEIDYKELRKDRLQFLEKKRRTEKKLQSMRFAY